MKNTIIVAIAVAVVVGSGAFYGGMRYARANGMGLFGSRQGFANLTGDQRQQFMANSAGGARGSGRGGMMGGFTEGEIIAKDDKSITIKLPDSGSKIVFFSEATEVGKSTSGSVADLKVGDAVTTSGTPNSDGSLTARTIQIRPLPSATPVAN